MLGVKLNKYMVTLVSNYKYWVTCFEIDKLTLRIIKSAVEYYKQLLTFQTSNSSNHL